MLSGRTSSAFKIIKKQLFFSELFLVFIEGYIDFLIAGGLFLRNQSFGLVMMNWTAFFIIATMTVLLIPGFILWLAKQSTSKFEEEDFKDKWKALFEDLKVKTVPQRLFYLVFILRRASFVASAFIFIDDPAL